VTHNLRAFIATKNASEGKSNRSEGGEDEGERESRTLKRDNSKEARVSRYLHRNASEERKITTASSSVLG